MKKRNLTVLFAAALVLAMASAAHATDDFYFNFSADCYGWSLDAFIHHQGLTEIPYSYWVALVQNGDTLCYEYHTGIHYVQEPFYFSGEWCGEFCGELKAVINYHWYGKYGYGRIKRDVVFYCPCDDFGCTYTPGYWKTHPDAWPLDHMTLGGIHYDKNQLMKLFWTPPAGGDMTVVLAHHLMAAILNVASGADDSIQGTIDDANAYLEMYPIFSRPRGAAKDQGEYLKDLLAAYNELPCEEDYDDGMDALTSMTAPTNLNAPAATEETSWGALKRKMQ